MSRRHFKAVFTFTLSGLVLIGCGGTRASAPSGAPATTHLRIANFAFQPKTLTVNAGARITVSNRDSTAHTATARSGAFDSGTIKPGASVSFTIKKPGIYHYYCQFHAFMTGTIRVVR